MQRLVLGTFKGREDAESLLNQIKESGIDSSLISIFTKDREDADNLAASTGAEAATGSGIGASSGAMTGAAVGLIGALLIGATAIPGINLLAAGPLAALLGATLTGAAAGGLTGALVGLGVAEHQAHEFNERVQKGETLLGVPVDEKNENEVLQMFKEANATDTRVIDVKEKE